MKKTMYLILIILLVGVGHYMFKENKVENVFDEMYYAKIQSVPKLYTSTSYISLINTNVLRSLPLNMRNEFINLKRESYRAESLKKNEELNLFFDKEEKKVEIIGILNVNEIIGEALRFSYIYYVEHEKMKIEKIEWIEVSSNPTAQDHQTDNTKEVSEFLREFDLTEEDLIDYQNYFLYEKVLSDWFAHNPKSRFSLDDLGAVEIVEADLYEE